MKVSRIFHLLMIAGLCFGMADIGFAKKKKRKKRKKDNKNWEAPYGLAGCGLGSMLISEKTGIIQVFAMTSNSSSASQTFGITSGTSNCTTAKQKMASEQTVFVKQNIASLQTESAKGSGEYLDSFSQLIGCDAKMLGDFSKSNYNSLYNSDDPVVVLSNYRRMLNKKCTRTS